MSRVERHVSEISPTEAERIERAAEILDQQTLESIEAQNLLTNPRPARAWWMGE